MDESGASSELQALEIVLKGGSPWGFTIKGGTEVRSALIVSRIEPRGKCDTANGLLVGDIILSINDVHCSARTEAIQLVKSAFNTLTLTVLRGSLESNASPSSSLSFLRRAQELKEHTEREKSKDDSVIETRNNYSLKSRKRPESFNLKAGRNRPQSWHPTAGDGSASLKLRSQSESSDYNELTEHRDSQTRATAMPISEYERENPFRETYHNNVDKQLGNPYHSMQNLHNAKTLPKEQLHNTEYYRSSPRRSYGEIPAPFHGLSQAKSTPVLNKDQIEKDRKSSVYQTLNVKSGLNFSPTKQKRGHGPWEKSTWDSYSEQRQYGYDNSSLRPWENQESRAGYRPVNVSSHRLMNRSNSNYENVLYEDRENEAPDIPPVPSDTYQHTEAEAPPSPPTRNASSLKYMGSPIHERFPSWPVKAKFEKQHQQFKNLANSSHNVSSNPKGIPTTHYNQLRQEKQQNKDVEAKEVSPKLPNFRTDNIHHATVAKVSSLDEDEDYIKLSKTFPLQSNAGPAEILSYMEQSHYPPPMVDSHGKGFGDKDYTVPSPPERDVPINSEHLTNSPENRDLSPDSKNLIAQYQETMQSNSSTPTNDVHKSNASSLSTTPIADTPDSQNDSYTYLVHSIPHYNTSTQTDASSKDNKTTWTNVALKRQTPDQVVKQDVHSKYNSKSNDKFVSSGTQMSPTHNDLDTFTSGRVPERQDTYSHHSFIEQWRKNEESSRYNESYMKNNDDYMNMNMHADNDSSNYVNMGPAPGETDVYNFAKAKVVKASDNPPLTIPQGNNSENSIRNISQLPVSHQYTDSAPMLRKLSEEMYRQKHNEERQHARLKAEQEAQRHRELLLEQQRQLEEGERLQKEEQMRTHKQQEQRQSKNDWTRDLKHEKQQVRNKLNIHIPERQESIEEPSTPEPVAPPRKKRDSVRKVRRQDMKNRQSVLELQDRAIVQERLATFETEVVLNQSNTDDTHSPHRKSSMKRAYGIYDDTDQVQGHKDNRLESSHSYPSKTQARQESHFSQYDSKQLGQIAEEEYSRNLSEPRDQRIAQIERMAKDIEQRKLPGKLKRTASEQIRPIKQRDLEHERHSTSRGRLESDERNVPQRRESLRETGRSYGEPVIQHERRPSDNAIRATEPFDMKRSSRSSSHGSESEHEHNKSRETIEGYNIRPSALSYDPRKRPVSGQVFVGGKIDGKQPEIRKTQQQALLNFYSMKTGKKVESNENSDSEKVPKEQYGITLPGYNSDVMSHTLPVDFQHEFQKPQRPNRRSFNVVGDSKHMRASSDSSSHHHDMSSSRSNHDSRRSTNSSTSSHDRSSSHHSWERERPASISVSSDEKGPSLVAQVQQQLMSSSQDSKDSKGGHQTHQLSRTYEYPSSSSSGSTSPAKTPSEKAYDEAPALPPRNYNMSNKKQETEKKGRYSLGHIDSQTRYSEPQRSLTEPSKQISPSESSRAVPEKLRNRKSLDSALDMPDTMERNNPPQPRRSHRESFPVKNYENISPEFAYADQLRRQARKISYPGQGSALNSASYKQHKVVDPHANVSNSRPVDRPQVIHQDSVSKSAFMAVGPMDRSSPPIGTSSPKTERAKERHIRKSAVEPPIRKYKAEISETNLDMPYHSHNSSHDLSSEDRVYPPRPYKSRDTRSSDVSDPRTPGAHLSSSDEVFTDDSRRPSWASEADRPHEAYRDRSAHDEFMSFKNQANSRQYPRVNRDQKDTSFISTAPPKSEVVVKATPARITSPDNSPQNSLNHSPAELKSASSVGSVRKSPFSAFKSPISDQRQFGQDNNHKKSDPELTNSEFKPIEVHRHRDSQDSSRYLSNLSGKSNESTDSNANIKSKSSHYALLVDEGNKNQAPVISHSRQKSAEELECDTHAAILAQQIKEQDVKLSEVLAPPRKSTGDYISGLFDTGVDPNHKRRVSSPDKSSASNSPKPQDILHERTDSMNSKGESPLPANSAYWSSPGTASLENKMRQEGMNNDDIIKEMGSGDIIKKKEELIMRMKKKLDVLKQEKDLLDEEIKDNEELGKQVTAVSERKCRNPNEFEKYKLYVDELDKIMRLLLKLSGRLARAENAVMSLPDNAEASEKTLLEEKRDKLSKQHEDAKMLKEGIDKRSKQVAKFLKEYLTPDEYEDYDHYVKMKAKLTLDFYEIEDKCKMGEEQLMALKKSMATI